MNMKMVSNRFSFMKLLSAHVILKKTYTTILFFILSTVFFASVSYPQGYANFRTIKCLNDQVAMMVGEDGAIAKSTNGGVSWQAESSGITNVLKSLLIVDKTTILVVAENGVILKTTDEGETWNYVLPVICDLNDITMLKDTQRIFICGDNGKMLFSDDTGHTWTNVSTGTTANLRHMHFADDLAGYAVGDNATLLKTITGGLTWTSIDLSAYGKYNFNSIAVINKNHFTIVGNESLVLYSFDGGISITTAALPYIHTANFYDIVSINSREEVMVGSSGVILKSIDGGGSWALATINKTKTFSIYSNFVSVSFSSSKCGIAIGPQGMNYYTGDGGDTWTGAATGCNVIKTKAFVSEKGLALNQNFPNPFNPSTAISYYLPFDAAVTLKVYDMLGKQVTSLVNGNQPAGSYNFRFNGADLSSGIYFCVLKATGSNINFSKTMRMILTK